MVVLALVLMSASAAPLHETARTTPVSDLPDVTSVPNSAAELPSVSTVPSVVTVATPGGTLTIPILMYHYVLDVSPGSRDVLLFNLSTSRALFARQMALLHAEGATPISPAMLMQALAAKRALPPHPVLLTFDDGYTDFATAAAPVLLRYGFAATDYVVSGLIGHPGYMTAAQVKRMDAEGLVIGSHTVHHVDLAAVAPAVALAEIYGGKAALEQLLGHTVLDFAYPYGGFNAAVVQLVRAAGFRDAVTTMGGDTQTLAGAFVLHRTHIGGAMSLATFAALAGIPPPTAAQLVAIGRSTPAQLAWLARLAN
ncbi:MAG: polysaccharide deacetylase family protein [Candidatus Dormibacter sp.]